MTSNRDLSKRFIEEVINGRKLSVIDETVAADFVYIDSIYRNRQGQRGPQRIVQPSLLRLPRPDLDGRAGHL